MTRRGGWSWLRDRFDGVAYCFAFFRQADEVSAAFAGVDDDLYEAQALFAVLGVLSKAVDYSAGRGVAEIKRLFYLPVCDRLLLRNE